MASVVVPSTQQALKVKGAGSIILDKSCTLLRPRAEEVLVRIQAVALNPFDWKSLDMSPAPGSTWGCDFSGVVVECGSNVVGFAAGDRVAGAAPGNNPDEPNSGAFAEYANVPAAILFKVPSWLSFEEAATLGCGLLTIGLALYHVLELPLPYSKPQPNPQYVLIYGGGTATGTLAIQAAKL
jgi:aspyridone synthetase trans-acting enoyl reductase